MQLRARIQSTGKTAAGVVVPHEFVAALGSSRHPRVRVTLGSCTFRSSIASMAGRFMLPMTAETRERAAVAAGDEVDLEVDLDDQPREVSVPADLAAALERDNAARRRGRDRALAPPARPHREERIKEAKNGCGLIHLPMREVAANRAWQAAVVAAHNLATSGRVSAISCPVRTAKQGRRALHAAGARPCASP